MWRVASDPANQALQTVPEDAQRLVECKLRILARAHNWSVNTDTMGVYGDYYLKRAIVTRLGLGAKLPGDAIYPLNLGDDTGKPLEGANNYVLHFSKDTIPLASAFWSVTVYCPQRYQVANPHSRFTVSSWMHLHYNPDGSPTFYSQNEDPVPEKETNWLPAPKGPFNLTMRHYAPKSDALTGLWDPPPVTRAAEPAVP